MEKTKRHKKCPKCKEDMSGTKTGWESEYGHIIKYTCPKCGYVETAYESD